MICNMQVSIYRNTVYQNATQIYINIYIIAKFYILKISKNKDF